MFLPTDDCLTTVDSHLHSTALHLLSLIVLLITYRHGSHRKHRSSVAVHLLLSEPRRKHNSFLVACAQLFSRLSRGRRLATGLYATIILLFSCRRIVQNLVWNSWIIFIIYILIRILFYMQWPKSQLWVVYSTWRISFRTILINSIRNKEISDVFYLHFTNQSTDFCAFM
jgi:hypothetical protein